MKSIFLKRASSTLLYVGLLAIVTGGRGYLLAHTIDGRYRWQDWLMDSMAFGLIVLVIKLLDLAIQALAAKLLPDSAMGRALGLGIRIVLLVFGFFPFLLATLQVHPQRIATIGTPADWDLPYEDVVIHSRGLGLRAWHCPNPGAKSAVFVAHGLNANRENFLGPVQMLHDLGHAVLIMDFPAHGDSEGRTTTLGLHEAVDVKAAHDWLTMKYPNQPIHALGYSMGASAVLTAAGQDGIFDRIVIDATFASIRHVADSVVLRYLGPLRSPVWAVGRFWIHVWTGADLDDHRPVDQIAKIPPENLLLIHGTADRVIPFAEGMALYEATGKAARFIKVDDYGHAETISHPDYAGWLDEFLKP